MKTGIHVGAKLDVNTVAGMTACVTAIMDKAFETRARDEVTLAAIRVLQQMAAVNGAQVSNNVVDARTVQITPYPQPPGAPDPYR